jgi:hypothetical protein
MKGTLDASLKENQKKKKKTSLVTSDASKGEWKRNADWTELKKMEFARNKLKRLNRLSKEMKKGLLVRRGTRIRRYGVLPCVLVRGGGRGAPVLCRSGGNLSGFRKPTTPRPNRAGWISGMRVGRMAYRRTDVQTYRRIVREHRYRAAPSLTLGGGCGAWGGTITNS